MTNPDNVGGLPDGMVMVQRSDAMRLAMFVEPLLTGGAVQLSAMRIAELCRAAPAGGDVTRRWHIERDGNDLLVCKGYHHRSDGCEFVRYTIAEDSAPAGSGELATELSEALHADGWTVLDPVQFGPNVSALLRKLQQGADYVMVPRVPTEAMRAAFTAESMPGFAAMTTIRIGDFGERYRYMIAASQGQEGGENG